MKFLRYPGGKSKSLFFLTGFLPQSEKITGRYIEPFVGGGSVFLYIQPERAVISDLNKELIDLYRGIKNYPHKVWETFKDFPIGKEAYYQIRDGDYLNKHLYYRAARTLYLNRTCFKGMWRHNPKGSFNVGYGGEERRWAISYENLIELSKTFKKATILRSDFEPILDNTINGDFIFLDPPYKPGEKQMLQTHYINGRFSFQDQVRLSKKIKIITKTKKIKWMMTNSSHPDICGLYSGFNVKRIPRGVSNIIGVYTDESNEVVISNY
jgi:DNA adenine methylase